MMIKNEKEYNLALKRLELIFDAKKGSLEGNEAEILGISIDDYENKKYPIDFPNKLEALKFRLEQSQFSNMFNNSPVK